LFGELGQVGELVSADQVKSVGLVGVAQQQELAVGCELLVVVGAATGADSQGVSRHDNSSTKRIRERFRHPCTIS
jgi:hypothetical protein